MSAKSRFRKLTRPPALPPAPTCCARHIAQYAALRQLVYAPRPGKCLVCGGPPARRGLFLPFDTELYGGNAAQHRILGYWLCTVHTDAPRAAIEARLLQKVRQHAAPWN